MDYKAPPKWWIYLPWVPQSGWRNWKKNWWVNGDIKWNIVCWTSFKLINVGEIIWKWTIQNNNKVCKWGKWENRELSNWLKKNYRGIKKVTLWYSQTVVRWYNHEKRQQIRNVNKEFKYHNERRQIYFRNANLPIERNTCKNWINSSTTFFSNRCSWRYL
jgi:hypothetical protein